MSPPPTCTTADAALPDAVLADAQSTMPDGGDGTDGSIDGGARNPFPQLTPHLGRVMSSMKLVTLFASNDGDAAFLTGFIEALPSSAWWTSVGADYGLRSIDAQRPYTGPAITSSVSGDDAFAYVNAAIAAGNVPAPDGHTLYMLLLPSGHGILGSNPCGYHDAFPDTRTTIGDGIAVIRHCPPDSGEPRLDRVTKTISHEVIEAATDPTLRSYNLGSTPQVPWKEDVYHSVQTDGLVEVADLCEGARLLDRTGGYRYQRSWSNSAALTGGDPCVPAIDVPYYTLASDQDWYAGTPGRMISIPLTGVATASVAEWRINPHLLNVSGAFTNLTYLDYSATSDLGPISIGSCARHSRMTSGTQGELRVFVPPSAQSGDYAVFSIHSFRWDSSCRNPLDEDLYHALIVGVYVP
jgi:hypothetical protein